MNEQGEQPPSNVSSTETRNEPMVSESFMRHRIDPDNTLKEIKRFLNGMVLVVDEDNEGRPVYNYQQKIRPKANDEGINAIMHFMTSYINKDIVQANFMRTTDYLDFIGKARMDLIDLICPNMERWEIRDEDLQLIVTTCMSYIKGFLTRAINNKERESYQESVKETHSYDQGKKDKKFGLF